MNRLRWLALLMGVAILGITGFQLYWLKQNYAREKRSLSIKTEMTFRETILQLQVAKLKLDGVEWNGKDSSKGKMKIVMHEKDGEQAIVRFKPKEEIVSTINVIRNKLKDSLKGNPGGKPGMVTISMNNTTVNMGGDSIKFNRHIQGPQGKGDRIFSFLYGVDSLQDSLRISEIDSAYSKALKEEKLNIPFSIVEKDSADLSDDPAFNEVTVGLANPVTYKLQLGNTFPYLLKQITQPILFSILLLGITILSFVLLYRNLLKQQRLAALKNEFISNITHELKTPIATVGVAIEALKNFNAIQDPKRTREYLDISSNELQRLSLLVDKVLKLSMFEKKEVELKYETFNLDEVVNEVVDSLKLQLEKNHASVLVTRKGDLTLQGDRLHLLSVIFNLLDNALKYSKENPAIKIDLQGNEENIILNVTDNGIGIPPEYKDKVFDKFFRIPHGDTHNAKGYGLGLSYVAQVIQKHNGSIFIESQPEIGTTFTITLPKNKI
ncbi:MAG: HAMP domain-containing histidine kinase [Chitinophagaceae bacterium]|nr:HAMP domain-containing histidine kinase [Chitinophagaceae bacterium]